jgi:hypothetical protein
MSYTKLFSSIVTSTIWTEDADTCKIWVTMLAIANKHGEVHAAIPGLAQIAGMSLEATEKAIAKFLAPDKYSRTPDDEGRRIEAIDGGWILLNHSKYRAMASKDEEKASNAKRQAAHRERKIRNGKVTESNGLSRSSNGPVTQDRDIAEAKAEAEAEAEADTDGGGEKSTATPLDFEKSTPEKANPKRMATFPQVLAFAKSQPMPISEECCEAFFDRMEAEGWITPNGFPLADWQPRFRSWITNWANNANRVRAK